MSTRAYGDFLGHPFRGNQWTKGGAFVPLNSGRFKNGTKVVLDRRIDPRRSFGTILAHDSERPPSQRTFNPNVYKVGVGGETLYLRHGPDFRVPFEGPKRVLAEAKQALKEFAAWDESKHPRQPGGTDKGGEFAPAGGGGEVDRYSALYNYNRRALSIKKELAQISKDLARRQFPEGGNWSHVASLQEGARQLGQIANRLGVSPRVMPELHPNIEASKAFGKVLSVAKDNVRAVSAGMFAHRQAMRKNPTSWGFAGDLGEVRKDLHRAASHLSGLGPLLQSRKITLASARASLKKFADETGGEWRIIRGRLVKGK